MIDRTDDGGIRSTVSERGQVVIPKALRDRLGIRPGSELDFREERGRLVAVKVGGADPVSEVYGILAPGRATDDVLAELRGEPDAIDATLPSRRPRATGRPRPKPLRNQ